ncbi:hypothetical protein C1752_02005 [Acaryochloris thomasi RCC1774]|uniref:Uncharacterized protein n=1 Tax=Acaryochloris thomasi RCC1774 TaxID=1764569 RepID=A0A2W1JJN6_9CYAN|nr:hypothetical protein [Acaryochloris thomasi]PZD73619.1 hypothetical protein C1752_02005 [Acaryochloris thomasi RCC1774]
MALSIRRSYAWAYLTILFLGYTLAGWILAAYGAPSFVWILTLVLTVHLAKAGPDAIALSITWVVSLLWGAAYLGIHPQDFQWATGYAWGMSLLSLWFLALLLVVQLAFASPFIPRYRDHEMQKAYFLVKLIWSGLGIGGLTYALGGLTWVG